MHWLVFDPRRMPAWTPIAGGGLRAALRWAAHHTGLPIIVVAAIAVVVSWKLFKRTVRFGLEVVIAVAALLVATRFGWITW